ncbi:hypothetical protein [Quadrisphaera sp. INWT6]|uniref:hypothetical protein n=1 Tax=Quadrisphaera sp. INWT6 TaxID=2596917 RepID=UPI00189217D1|nr:hypothetical protein [Quadrisphaera sp. INWT6]MBF5082409.1 hypothetical protein [Quadrisphaera sp. INWT6]
MEDTWVERDLPLLTWLVSHFDQYFTDTVGLDQLAQHYDGSLDDVERGLAALSSAQPPYLLLAPGEMSMADRLAPVSGVTERARRTVGAWPSPESLAEALGRALVTASESEPDPVKKSKLRELGSFTLGAGRDLLVDITSAFITKSTGLN